MEIGTAGRHNVTVDSELTRHSFLPADGQAETGTASRQNVTVNAVDSFLPADGQNMSKTWMEIGTAGRHDVTVDRELRHC